jgi:hypothetical protein
MKGHRFPYTYVFKYKCKYCSSPVNACIRASAILGDKDQLEKYSTDTVKLIKSHLCGGCLYNQELGEKLGREKLGRR